MTEPDAAVLRVAEWLRGMYPGAHLDLLGFIPDARDLMGLDPEIVTEHAREMTGGWYLRRDEPLTESVYPLAQWIRHGQENGGRVYRRRIIVVDDWEEVPRGQPPAADDSH